MTFKLGLTGSIGMGKSTTAQMFVDEGCALWDADAAVHRLYSKGGAAVDAIFAAFPQAVSGGAVDRSVLRDLISADASVLKELEEIVHPLVREDRELFAAHSAEDILVLDIPLLFETGADAEMDAVVCVSISAELQEERVLARGTMTRDQFRAIRDKQLPNEEKCARSDYVITTETLEGARKQVQDVLKKIRGQLSDA